MGEKFNYLTEELQHFIAAQQMFFVATAPLSPQGHVNLSPKGLDSFRILAPNRVAYLDLTGSGNETSAHLHENQRITLMFCAFQAAPCILRLYGKGTTALPNTLTWESLHPLFPVIPGARQIIVVDIERAQTSCGFSVPLYEYQGQREELIRWASKKGEKRLQTYRDQNNRLSIDGLVTPLAAGEDASS